MGGSLVFSLRSEPKTLNPLLAVDTSSRSVIGLLMADLIHINRQTQKTEPALAKSWTASPDGLHYTLQLRRGLRFSDGQLFTADDVVFTWQSYLDEKIHSPQRDLLLISGKPILAEKVDDFTVRFNLPQPYAAAERLFDSVWILPRHLLASPANRAELASAWSLTTAPEGIAGLGPFRLKQYVPGQRIVFERNPYYWKRDLKGQSLPYLEAMTGIFAPNSDAEALRFGAGETDVISRLNPADFDALKQREKQGGFRLLDAGPGLEYHFLFFNENALPEASLPFPPQRQSWFREPEFRRAISNALDRAAMVRLAFRGRATPLSVEVTPGNKLWVNTDIPAPVRSLERARQLMRSSGFSWDREGWLKDGHGDLVEFSILVNAGNRQQVQMATLIQEDLKELGVRVTLDALEFHTYLDRIFTSFKYEAAIMAIADGDVDPNSDMNVLTSGGGTHVWSFKEMAPVPKWQLEVDRLMQEQMSEAIFEQRKRAYDRVQELIWENMPVICLVAPNILVGAKVRIGNFEPAIFGNYTLWNAERLFLR